MRKLRVLVLMHHYLVPPDDVSGHDTATADWLGTSLLSKHCGQRPSGASGGSGPPQLGQSRMVFITRFWF